MLARSAPWRSALNFSQTTVGHLGAIERLRGEAAIRGGDHVFASDQLGVAQDALGDQLGMLHDVAGVGDHAGTEHLARGNLDAFEQVIFVLVAGLAASKL